MKIKNKKRSKMMRMKLKKTLKKINKFMKLVRKYSTPFLARKMKSKSWMILMMKMILIIQIFRRNQLRSKLI